MTRWKEWTDLKELIRDQIIRVMRLIEEFGPEDKIPIRQAQVYHDQNIKFLMETAKIINPRDINTNGESKIISRAKAKSIVQFFEDECRNTYDRSNITD